MCKIVEAKHQHQILDKITSFLRRLLQNPSFLHHLKSDFSIRTGKSSEYLYSSNIIFDVWSFDNGHQGKGIIFLDLELQQALLNVKHLPSWNNADFTFYRSHIITMKNFDIFFFMLEAFSTDHSVDFITLGSLFL